MKTLVGYPSERGSHYRLWPPARLPACRHDHHQPFRQACCCCGVQDHIDFRVSDRAWHAVVPEWLDGVPYAKELERVDFVGDRGSFTLVPTSALDLEGFSETASETPSREVMRDDRPMVSS